MSGSHRQRLACVTCTKRKIRCDKSIPCENCIKRGQQATCRRIDDVEYILSAEASQTALPTANPNRAESRAIELMKTLSKIVVDLETVFTEQLQNANRDPYIVPSEKTNNRDGQNGNDRVRTAPSTNLTSDSRLPLSPTSSFRAPSLPVTSSTENCTSTIDKDSSASSEIADAATILEFLAWGRRKDPDYNAVVSPQATVSHFRDGEGQLAKSPATVFDENGFTERESTRLLYLDLLLPDREQVFRMVDYHETCLLWYHCSYHAGTFRKELAEFYEKHNGSVESPGISLQWVALLFAIICGTLTSASRQAKADWGFCKVEAVTLSKRWYKAATTCLNLADYMACPSLHSVETVATLTLAAHVLGFSNIQTVLIATAIRISQTLGLHRLGAEKAEASDHLIERETARRVWCQLATQDFFSIPFTETYSINLLYASTDKPRNCHDEDMKTLADDVPTVTTYCRVLYDIALLIPKLQDGMASSNTLYTKYEQVLQYDAKMRSLVTADLPAYLGPGPVDPRWPCYVPWARRCLRISSSHKIIMIHRKFLGLSFTNPAFTFTRRTCVAASKTILKSQKEGLDENIPVLWIEQAFAVAACIILSLDMIHRSPNEPDWTEHMQSVSDAIEILRQSDDSMIALRGVKILSALLKKAMELRDEGLPDTTRKRKSCSDQAPAERNRKRRLFDIPTFVNSFWEDAQAWNPESTRPTVSISKSRREVEQMTSGILDPDMSNIQDCSCGSSGEDGACDNFMWNQAPFGKSNILEDLLFLAQNDDFNY